MHTVLMGDHPRDEWLAIPASCSVLDEARLRQLKANYDICLQRFGHLQLLELMSYQEPQPGVRVTKFEDGTEVVADFTHEELVVNGEPVLRPEYLQAQPV